VKLDEIQEKPIKRPLESDRWTMKQGNGRHGSLDGVINDAHSLRVLCVSTNSQPEAARCQPKAAERRPNGERASSFPLLFLFSSVFFAASLVFFVSSAFLLISSFLLLSLVEIFRSFAFRHP